MVFTDETTVCVAERSSHFNWRGAGQRLTRRDFSVKTAFPTKVVFWGCFSFAGVGPRHVCHGTINSTASISILKECLLPQALAWFQDTSWVLVEDNAPCHNSRATNGWLQQHGFNVMKWPENSPDLNPIENMWSVLKAKLCHISCITNTDLIRQSQKICNEDDSIKALCEVLINSMPIKIEDVIHNHGGVD